MAYIDSSSHNDVNEYSSNGLCEDNANYEQLVTSKDTNSYYHTVVTDHTSRDVSSEDVDSSNYLVPNAFANSNDNVDLHTYTQLGTGAADDSYDYPVSSGGNNSSLPCIDTLAELSSGDDTYLVIIDNNASNKFEQTVDPSSAIENDNNEEAAIYDNNLEVASYDNNMETASYDNNMETASYDNNMEVRVTAYMLLMS